MTWKELYVEGRLKLGVLGRVVFGLLVGAGFIPVVLILYFTAIEPAAAHQSLGALDWFERVMANVFSRWDEIGGSVNIWLRTLNVIISVLMLLGVAVRAAGSIGGERDRDTLLSLMTTTLTTREIMAAKWLGALASVRGFLWWLGSVWLIAIVLGGVNPAAILLQACAWLAPAVFFASMGLWLSAVCRTTLRAIAWTIAVAILAGGGHWACMGMCCYAPLGFSGTGSRDMTELVLYAEAGLTPPFIFGWAPFREFQDLVFSRSESGMPAAAVIGMVVWVIAAGIAFSAAHECFIRLTNRGPIDRNFTANPRRNVNRGPRPGVPRKGSGEPPYRPDEPVV